jgi:type II secretory pathway pseudopilin PulG
MLCFKTPIVLVIVLLLVLAVAASPVWAEQSGSSTAISSAQTTILYCFNAAKDAEAAGANITVLVGTLNEAGSLLSQAESVYAINDFDTAYDLAVQSQNTLSGFVAEANALREAAVQQQNQGFLVNIVGSAIGTFVVIAAGFAAWLLLKKKYETTQAHVRESSGV